MSTTRWTLLAALLVAPSALAQDTDEAPADEATDEATDEVPADEEPTDEAPAEEPTDEGAPDPAELPTLDADQIWGGVLGDTPPDAEEEEPARRDRAPLGARPPDHRFGVVLLLGGGPVAEQDLDANGAFGVLVDARYTLPHALRVEASFSDRVYRPTYLSTTPSPGGGLATVQTSEQLQAAWAGVSLELLETIPPLERLTELGALRVHAAPAWLHLANEVFGTWAGSLRLGLSAEVFPVDGLRLRAGTGFLPRFFGRQDTLSAMGRPKVFWDFQAGAGLDLGERPRWSIELGWRADSVVFQHSTRVVHLGYAGLGLVL